MGMFTHFESSTNCAFMVYWLEQIAPQCWDATFDALPQEAHGALFMAECETQCAGGGRAGRQKVNGQLGY